MDGPAGILLSSKSEKNKYSMISLHDFTMNTENKLMAARGEGSQGAGEMGEGEWEVQASSYGTSKSQEYKVLHREYSQ